MIILDASVVNKLFLPAEEDRDKARKLFNSKALHLEEIIVPDLLFYEIANTLATKSTILQAQAIRSVNKLYKLKLGVIHVSEKQIKSATRFAKKYQVTVYDAIYAVLAKEKKCNLITADNKFADKVNLGFVKKLSEV